MGPDETMERLYRDQGDRLWWAILAFSGDRTVADDAVADAFSQALARGDELREPLAWIWRVAFLLARAELKRRSSLTHTLPDTYVEDDHRPAELIELLAHLSEQQRAAVLLFYYADRPIKEVAATLGVKTSTAKVHLHRGRKALRSLLEDRDD